MYTEDELPSLERIIKDLKIQQKIREEKDMWMQKRSKTKKDPLIDISQKLSSVLQGSLVYLIF